MTTQLSTFVSTDIRGDLRSVNLKEGGQYYLHYPHTEMFSVKVIKIRQNEVGAVFVHYKQIKKTFLGIPTRWTYDIKGIDDFSVGLVDLGSVKQVNLKVKKPE